MTLIKILYTRFNIELYGDGKSGLPEDLIGLKVQAISNDPRNRFPVDAPDIQRILQAKIDEIDIELVRMYFELFNKEDLLDAWLSEINR